MHGVCRTAAMNLLTGVLFYNKNKTIEDMNLKSAGS